MYPMIFNVVLEAAIRYWVTVVAPEEAGKEGLAKTVQEMEEYLYAGGGIITSPWWERLQRLFGILTYLLY